jgi:uncharacterized protein YdhG (YjbR/CyaY superfamily)
MRGIAKAKNVDAYISTAPKQVQGKLREIRKIVKSAAPEAEEKISYGMPYYSYKGRLAYFAAFKDHVSLFAMPPVVGELRRELRKYQTGKSTIQFPLDQKLPLSLIRMLIEAGVKKNEMKNREK